jgi:FKBP-type peptidyl-prolyl cis-trans isomerase SlyD
VTQQIADGMVVSMHYTLTNPDGQVIDSSSDGDPLTYLHGAGNIVPGLEAKLAGAGVGDKVNAVVAPADGYGERSGPEPQPVPRDRFPEDADLKPGMQIVAQGPSGEQFALWVVGLKDNDVLLDHNHPLAGVTLHFDVEVTEIRAATDEEKAHGHPHGPGGHDH